MALGQLSAERVDPSSKPPLEGGLRCSCSTISCGGDAAAEISWRRMADCIHYSVFSLPVFSDAECMGQGGGVNVVVVKLGLEKREKGWEEGVFEYLVVLFSVLL